jgi:hypothetical protein
MNVALLILHILILHTPPGGWLITMGCLIISFAVAIGGLMRSRLVKMVFASASIFLAIVGTWWVYANFAASTVDLTPLFRYDPAWSLTRVSLTALVVALLIGVFGNLISLTVKDE